MNKGVGFTPRQNKPESHGHELSDLLPMPWSVGTSQLEVMIRLRPSSATQISSDWIRFECEFGNTTALRCFTTQGSGVDAFNPFKSSNERALRKLKGSYSGMQAHMNDGFEAPKQRKMDGRDIGAQRDAWDGGVDGSALEKENVHPVIIPFTSTQIFATAP